MDPNNDDSPFTSFCLTYLAPISDLLHYPLTPFREKTNTIIPIPQKRPSDSVNCSCKKSQCSKLYCECYAKGKYCLGCSCNGCKNVPSIKDKVQSMIKKGCCSCKKSACCKKYCECFQAKRKCCESCKCEKCKNKTKIF